VVREDERAGDTGDRGGQKRQASVSPGVLGEDVPSLDGTYQGLVYFAPAVVGTSHTVWYAEDGTSFVSVDRPTAAQCKGYDPESLVQDEDVLDTWFSSWLWPFSTFGWPEKTADLKNSTLPKVLVTASEIIFLWLARMVMAGYEFMEDCRSPTCISTGPFETPTE
jgi:hypothetical protein